MVRKHSEEQIKWPVSVARLGGGRKLPFDLFFSIFLPKLIFCGMNMNHKINGFLLDRRLGRQMARQQLSSGSWMPAASCLIYNNDPVSFVDSSKQITRSALLFYFIRPFFYDIRGHLLARPFKKNKPKQPRNSKKDLTQA